MNWFLFYTGMALITFHQVANTEPRPSGTRQWVAAACIAALWPALWLFILADVVFERIKR